MSESITKLVAARRQLEQAITMRLAGVDSVSMHTLAYASYCLLRDLLGLGPTMAMLRKLEKNLDLGNVPNFLKHAETDPARILKEHSAKTAHLTIALALMLWKEHGQAETALMKQFWTMPDPHKPVYRHSPVFRMAGMGTLREARRKYAVTLSTTGGGAFSEVEQILSILKASSP